MTNAGDTEGPHGHKLEEVIARIDARVESRLSFADEKVHSGAAILILVRIMLAHARALVLVSAAPFAETGSSHVRAMFEAWVDIYSILEPGSEEEHARRCVAFGLIEYRDQMAKRGFTPEQMQPVYAAIQVYVDEYPTLVADVELQRTKGDRRNSNYWSGFSRTELINRMEAKGVGSTLRDIYKLLSWDAHHVIAVALRTSISRDKAGELQVAFHPMQLPEDFATVDRELATKMLVKAWYQVATHLQVDPG